MSKFLLKNASIVDGSGKKAFKGNIAVREERIFAVGDIKKFGEKEIDANGLTITPGFIDAKSRIDFDWSFLNYPNCHNLIAQGITSVIAGNFGFSLFPVLKENLALELEKWAPETNMTINWLNEEELFNILEEKGIGVNFGTLLGYRVLRRGIVGEINRPLKKDEVEIVKKMIKESIQKGVLGVSVEFSRIPNNPESDEEIFEILDILKDGGVLSLNFAYGEKEPPLYAFNDLVKMLPKRNVALDISEFAYKGETIEILKGVEKLAQKGFKVSISIGPYPQDIIALSSYLPSWLHEGGVAKMLKRLKKAEIKKFVLEELKKKEREFLGLRVAQTPLNPKFAGVPFKEIALKQGVSGAEALINLLLASEGRALGFRYLKEVISEKDLEEIIKSNTSMVVAEGGGHSGLGILEGTICHPRDFGAFPYFLKHFSQEKNIISFEEAIHKITGFPAEKFGLKERGIIKEGNFADFIILNPKEIDNRTDFEGHYYYPDGIKAVFINGGLAYQEGKFSSVLRGQVLKNERLQP